MQTLSYKGFIGSIEVSIADNCLCGEVLFLPNDTKMLYEGNTVAELEADFHDSVDSYLDYCLANHIKPKRSFSGNLNVRISSETHAKLAEQAQIKGISLNTYIGMALDKQAAMV